MTEPTPNEFEKKALALAPAPEGYRWVWNRRSHRVEEMFDGRPIYFAPHEFRLLSAECAERIVPNSLLPGTLKRKPGGGGALMAERQLSLGPGWFIARWNRTSDTTGAANDRYIPEYAEATPDEGWLKPSEAPFGTELFDRKSLPNYVDRPSAEGRPTHVEAIPV